MNSIDTRQFAALVERGAVKTVAVTGTNGGFFILADGTMLEARRGHPRLFRRLNTAAAFLRGHGIGTFAVDVSKWNPDQKAIP